MSQTTAGSFASAVGTLAAGKHWAPTLEGGGPTEGCGGFYTPHQALVGPETRGVHGAYAPGLQPPPLQYHASNLERSGERWVSCVCWDGQCGPRAAPVFLGDASGASASEA